VRDKTSDDHIRNLASTVVGGDNKMVDQLRDIAQKNDFKFDEEASSSDRKGTKDLEKLHGSELDRAFLENTVRDHEELLTIFKKGAADAHNQDLRDWFDKKQDGIREHRDKAQALLKEMKDR
jgi:predicted outer membrane protein